MARSFKHKLADGTEIEIPLPEGYLTPDDLDGFVPRDNVEKIVAARAAQAKRSASKELLADEEFRTTALAAWGVKVDDGKGGGAGADAITAALKDYERQNVEPLRKEITARDLRVGKLLEAKLAAELAGAAARAGVRSNYLKPLPGQRVPAVVSLFAPAFGFDEEAGEYFVKSSKGDGFAVSGDPEAAHPWKGVEQFFTELAKSKEYVDFFNPTGQGGPGVKDAGRVTAPGTVDRNDPLAFGRAAADILTGKVTAV